MKLFLLGGLEKNLNQRVPFFKIIERIILDIKPKQVLCIPFARFELNGDGEYACGKYCEWYDFMNQVNLPNIQILNAMNESDLKKAINPLIYVWGGRSSEILISKIRANKKILDLVLGAEYYIGESAGAMIVGEHVREGENMIKGLDILKDTIIEPHYTERDRYKLLLDELGETGVKYGIGIDCMTGISFDLKDFPNKYETIGDGLVEVKTRD